MVNFFKVRVLVENNAPFNPITSLKITLKYNIRLSFPTSSKSHYLSLCASHIITVRRGFAGFDEETGQQLFPFRTLAMVMCSITVITVSRLTRWELITAPIEGINKIREVYHYVFSSHRRHWSTGPGYHFWISHHPFSAFRHFRHWRGKVVHWNLVYPLETVFGVQASLYKKNDLNFQFTEPKKPHKTIRLLLDKC